MEQISPLIQTVLWVGLIAGILWRFYKPIYGLLLAIQRRVETGSNVKIGPVEIAEQLKPQDPSKQKERAATEVQEVLQAAPELAQMGSSASVRGATAQARYFQAEDLVLRAIQAEYGATVSRQVTLGADMDFDGAFVTSGRLNIVEVKYFAGPASAASKLRVSLDHLASGICRYGWRNVQIILAVVFERAEDVAKGSEKLQELSATSSVPLVVRCFSLSELQLRFGVASPNAG